MFFERVVKDRREMFCSDSGLKHRREGDDVVAEPRVTYS